MQVFALLTLFTTLFAQAPAPAPQTVADELLAADRAFSEASGATDLVSGVSAMFGDDVALMTGGRLVQGKAAAVEALRANADNMKARVRWFPVRAGVSADGEHGFTFGVMLAERDGKTEPTKYLAYWIKGAAGWRVAAYKRVRAAADTTIPPATMPPALPERITAAHADAATLARHRDTLAAAERAFSTEAQSIGLGPAFAKYGSADAINLGGPNVPAFLVGSAAIGSFIGKDSPQPRSPVSWAPERVIVASSGDLGVTIGTISTVAGSPARTTPFFTVWRRTAGEWKYIAE